MTPVVLGYVLAGVKLFEQSTITWLRRNGAWALRLYSKPKKGVSAQSCLLTMARRQKNLATSLQQIAVKVAIFATYVG